MELSSYQKAILDEWNNTDHNLAIEAGPGSGKTFMLLQLAKTVKMSDSAIFLAFNKSIAEELSKKLPFYMKAMTLHSLGMRTLLRTYGFSMTVKEDKTFLVCKKYFDQFKFYGEHGKDFKKKMAYIFSLAKVYDLYRFNMVEDINELKDLCIDYDIPALGDIDMENLKTMIHIMDTYNQMLEPGGMIDFTDMLWLCKDIPKSKFQQYKKVFVDECLPYYMPVLCEGGKSIPIGKIVEDKLDVKVLSYNENTGVQEYKRILGYSKTPAQRRMFKVKGKTNSKDSFGNHRRSFVVCSDNHRIYIEGKGYLYPEQISEGDILQFENSAEITQKYKITLEGKNSLSNTMKRTNEKYEFHNDQMKSKPFSGVQGGNGKFHELQNYFAEALGEEWEMEIPIVTSKEQRSFYNAPNCYKVDLYNKELKVAIEIDGSTHDRIKAKERDFKKDKILNELGIKVIRIKRGCLSHNFDKIVNSIKRGDFEFDYENCVEQMVVESIEETSVKEDWIYDIEVEDNHNFYANGILVHNCQDLNSLQRMMVEKILSPSGRLVSVGDSFQSIYIFAGASLSNFQELKNRPNTVTLPLSITYRCSRHIVDKANEVFEGLESAPGAEDGIVEPGAISEIQPGDFVLCRNNKPLVQVYIRLLKNNLKASIYGKDYEKKLLKLLDKCGDVDDRLEALDILNRERIALIKELESKGYANPEMHPSVGSFDEAYQILEILFDEKGVQGSRSMIERMFRDDIDSKSVMLMTCHKSKGLEADRVFFLNQELIPSQYATSPQMLYAEKCLAYVTITRAKKVLKYIHIDDNDGRE